MMSIKPIKIMIAHESEETINLLQNILDAQPDMTVILSTRNGNEIVEAVKSQTPDIILLGINLEEMNGADVTRHVMKNKSATIIIVSNHLKEKQSLKVFDALSVGAVTVVPNPVGMTNQSDAIQHLLSTIKIHQNTSYHHEPTDKTSAICNDLSTQQKHTRHQVDVVGIGASTGGPKVLKHIFDKLNQEHMPPIAVVLHISDGFLPNLINWLKFS